MDDVLPGCDREFSKYFVIITKRRLCTIRVKLDNGVKFFNSSRHTAGTVYAFGSVHGRREMVMVYATTAIFYYGETNRFRKNKYRLRNI